MGAHGRREILATCMNGHSRDIGRRARDLRDGVRRASRRLICYESGRDPALHARRLRGAVVRRAALSHVARGGARARAKRWRTTGLVPTGTAATIRDMKLELDAARIEAIERTTQARRHRLPHARGREGGARGALAAPRHDVERRARYLTRHPAPRRGRPAPRALSTAARRPRQARASSTQKTPMIGRSHGIFAEPVTFGLALAGHHAEIARGSARLEAARAEIAVGKIAGAVGTYAHLSPDIESARAREARPGRRDGEHAGRRARPARELLRRARARRGEHRTPRDERPPLAAVRGGRGRRSPSARARRARARCPTSATPS